jgi:hypothetical protein
MEQNGDYQSIALETVQRDQEVKKTKGFNASLQTNKS